MTRTARTPSFPSSKSKRVHRFACLYLCATTLLLLRSAEGVAAPPQDGRATSPADQTIIIHADRNLGAPRLRQGLLHGVTYSRGRDYSRTVDLVSALKPKSWRLSSEHNDVYDFVVGEAKLPSRLGTEIVFVIQDAFHARYGFNVGISDVCRPSQRNCFSSYDAFKKSWLDVVNNLMAIEVTGKFIIDYIDVFSEPNWGSTQLGGLAPEQLGDLFKSTHDTVRHYRPDAKIVAPSIVSYGERYLKTFLRFVANNKLRLDALSWHEFGSPNAVPGHVAEMRQFIKSLPELCNPNCPEIHINEYAPDSQDLTPGYGVGWLYYLEKAQVDHANRACWDHPRAGSTCWNGFDGMLLQDNVTPQPIYWVYKAYADLTNSRLSSESSLPQTVALASKDDSKREMRILAGKYGQHGASGRVTIEVNGLHYNISSAVVEIWRIPDSGNGVQPLPALPPPVREAIRIHENSLSVVIPEFHDGEAYSLFVRPGGNRNAP